MNIPDALIVLEYADPERFYNIIANIFDMVLEGAPMIPPHDLSQLKPYLILKVSAPVRYQVYIS